MQIIARVICPHSMWLLVSCLLDMLYLCCMRLQISQTVNVLYTGQDMKFMHISDACDVYSIMCGSLYLCYHYDPDEEL